MKARVSQLFEVRQHEFANFSLPCEGHFNLLVYFFSFFVGRRTAYLKGGLDKVLYFYGSTSFSRHFRWSICWIVILMPCQIVEVTKVWHYRLQIEFRLDVKEGWYNRKTKKKL